MVYIKYTTNPSAISHYIIIFSSLLWYITNPSAIILARKFYTTYHSPLILVEEIFLGFPQTKGAEQDNRAKNCTWEGSQMNQIRQGLGIFFTLNFLIGLISCFPKLGEMPSHVCHMAGLTWQSGCRQKASLTICDPLSNMCYIKDMFGQDVFKPHA